MIFYFHHSLMTLTSISSSIKTLSPYCPNILFPLLPWHCLAFPPYELLTSIQKQVNIASKHNTNVRRNNINNNNCGENLVQGFPLRLRFFTVLLLVSVDAHKYNGEKNMFRNSFCNHRIDLNSVQKMCVFIQLEKINCLNMSPLIRFNLNPNV